MTAAIVIPARMASMRFPNKPLARIKGKTMIERVWELGMAVQGASEVVIATDSEELKGVAEGFGAKVVMTSPHHLTGTDRVAEVAAMPEMPHAIFFSFQGDAVLTPPWVIEEVLRVMLADPTILLATPAVHLQGQALDDFVESKRQGSTSGTSVVFDLKGDALYFSKTLIPYDRSEKKAHVYRHIGLYAYRREILSTLGALPEGRFEKAEKIEVLRALENGIKVRVVPVDYRGRTHGSVDRPEDIAFVESVIEREGELLVEGRKGET